jgi:hypothetical protein
LNQGIILPVAKSLYLCDGHLGLSTQKTDLIGVFDAIKPNKYPHVQKYFVVFARLVQGLGTFPFWIDIRFAATNQFVTSSLVHQLNFPNRDILVNMVMTMMNVPFPQAGLYLVELFLDNQWVADTTLELK